MKLSQWPSFNLKKQIDSNLLNIIQKNVDSEIFDILYPQISVSKRIRSLFLYILTKGQIKNSDFIKVSNAIELFHQATLIYDDIIDDSEYRDGNRNVLHNIVGGGIKGAGIAQHIGEILITLSSKELLDLGNLTICKEFEDTKLLMFNAQLKDILFINKPIGKKWLDFLIEESYQKTSIFLQFPFKISNILIPESKQKLIISKKLGILYQIGDDLDDIRNGLQPGSLSLTYPLCYILDNTNVLDNDEKDFIFKIMELKELSIENANKLTSIFKKYKNLFKNDINERLSDITNDINNIEDNDLQNLSKEIINMVFSDSYWNYDFMKKS